MTTLAAPAPVPALARRPSLATALGNSLTLAWRSVLKIKTNPEDLFGLWLQPIMYLVLFTYDHRGYIEPGSMFIQLKAAESLQAVGAQYVQAVGDGGRRR